VALIKKRIIYFKRDKQSLFLEVIIPLTLIILSYFVLLIDFIPNPPSILLEPNIHPRKFTVNKNN